MITKHVVAVEPKQLHVLCIWFNEMDSLIIESEVWVMDP